VTKLILLPKEGTSSVSHLIVLYCHLTTQYQISSKDTILGIEFFHVVSADDTAKPVAKYTTIQCKVLYIKKLKISVTYDVDSDSEGMNHGKPNTTHQHRYRQINLKSFCVTPVDSCMCY
jgi:hypothetical protein